ncbi:MAG: hypothetical protein DWQ35_15015 [Planctomycetota bacterium]|nr:MAG: hypothetical protein DWQ35_15015 [Planctomycetota bacterium]REK18450.1 MAG: hypothetical protein DWQ42_19670 [Planctomycetota bacterium]REK39489.1 MAG: hypothetical protein DWQ46_19835 [Planctomycetota bacterium]
MSVHPIHFLLVVNEKATAEQLEQLGRDVVAWCEDESSSECLISHDETEIERLVAGMLPEPLTMSVDQPQSERDEEVTIEFEAAKPDAKSLEIHLRGVRLTYDFPSDGSPSITENRKRMKSFFDHQVISGILCNPGPAS